jgi:hypothetical protein
MKKGTSQLYFLALGFIVAAVSALATTTLAYSDYGDSYNTKTNSSVFTAKKPIPKITFSNSNDAVKGDGSGAGVDADFVWIEDQTLQFDVPCQYDPPAPELPLCIVADVLPEGANFPDTSGSGSVVGSFDWHPNFCQSRPEFYDFAFKCSATCGGEGADVGGTIQVNNNNRVPSINVDPSGPFFVDVNSSVHINVNGSDPDTQECNDPFNKDELLLTQTSGPGTLVDNGGGDGDFTWVPQSNDLGQYPVTFGVTDGYEDENHTAYIAVIEGGGGQTKDIFLRGDANRDGMVDISDGIFILNVLFLGDGPFTCEDAADVNDDGHIDISDATLLFGSIFLGAEEPPAPGPFIEGLDPTEDTLTCGGSTKKTPPNILCPPNVGVEASAPDGQEVDIGVAASFDHDKGELIITNNAPEQFLLGTTDVTWTVINAATGFTALCQQSVAVVDTTPPTVVPRNRETFVKGEEIVLTRPDVYDAGSTTTVTIVNNATSTTIMNVGDKPIDWTVTDGGGNFARVTQIITILPAVVGVPAGDALIDIDVDTNRNAVIEDGPDEPDEEKWIKTKGALFMVNFDDDNNDDKEDGQDFNVLGYPTNPDIVINGIHDVKDITPFVIRVKATRAQTTSVTLKVSNIDQIKAVHVFKAIADGETKFWGGPGEGDPEKDITALVSYVAAAGSSADTTMGLEGLFFRYDQKDAYGGFFPNGYDGFIDLEVTLTTNAGGVSKDKVRLKVSPLILLPNTQGTKELWTGSHATNLDFRSGLDGERTYAMNARSDQWAQDHVEIGYTHAPGRPTTTITMRLPRAKRNAVGTLIDDTPAWPETHMLRKDFGLFRFRNTILHDNANSGEYGGNIEVVPPSTKWPLGKIIVGDSIGSKMYNFFIDQEVQDPFKTKSKWLDVAHIDEIVTFLPTVNGGWKAIIADPDEAKKIINAVSEYSLFFASGLTSTSTLTTEATTTPERLRDRDIDFRNRYNYAKYIRIFKGTGAGQIAEIDTTATSRGNGFLKIKKVWRTPTRVAELGPGGDQLVSNCVTECAERAITLSQTQWFATPDETSEYALFEDMKFWDSAVVENVSPQPPATYNAPAAISTREVKNDTTLWQLNTKAKGLIEDTKKKIKAVASVNDGAFIGTPDFYMGGFNAGAIVSRSAVAFSPALENFQPAGGKNYFPKVYGPHNVAEQDAFEKYITDNIPGVNRFVEDWNLYHRAMGGVHCGTNVVRNIDSVFSSWWSNQP